MLPATPIVVVAVLLALLAGHQQQVNGCGQPPPGKCCSLACPLFSPCALTKPCNTPPTPPVDPLTVLEKVFDGIGALFKSIEASLPSGSPALNVLENVFDGIGAIFQSVEAGLGGKRKRDVQEAAYRHKGTLGMKSAKAAHEAKTAIEKAGLKEDVEHDIERAVVDHRDKSAAERKAAYKAVAEKHGGEAKERLNLVIDAHSKMTADAKEAVEKLTEKLSTEAKEAGQKLITIILDEKMAPAEKDKAIEELVSGLKVEVKKELRLRSVPFIKRAAAIASGPFTALGLSRTSLHLEL